MTEQELKCTKVIAEFMGYFVTPFNGKYSFVCKEEKKPEQLNQAWMFRLEEAEFHEKYDWLMPVWQKFRDLKFVRMRTDLSIIHKTKCHDVAYAITHGTISEAFTALAEAIIWCNENKQ